MKSKDDNFDELMKKTNIAEVDSILQKMEERSNERFREATEFKPGELTEEEEIIVSQNNLNALNYIPIKSIKEQEQRCLEHADKMKRRSEILSRSVTDPERIDLINKERVEKINRGFTSRIDRFGYGWYLFFIALSSWFIKQSHGWAIGIFCLILMITVLELAYRLHDRN